MNMNATLILQSIAMLIFVWFCMQVVWPPILRALDERRARIADGLAASDRTGGSAGIRTNAARRSSLFCTALGRGNECGAVSVGAVPSLPERKEGSAIATGAVPPSTFVWGASVFATRAVGCRLPFACQDINNVAVLELV